MAGQKLLVQEKFRSRHLLLSGSVLLVLQESSSLLSYESDSHHNLIMLYLLGGRGGMVYRVDKVWGAVVIGPVFWLVLTVTVGVYSSKSARRISHETYCAISK